MTITKYSVGHRIQTLRSAKGLSQVDLGKLIGVRGDRISRWEQGHNLPRVTMRRKLALALGSQPELLFMDDRQREEFMYNVKMDTALRIVDSEEAVDAHALLAAARMLYR